MPNDTGATSFICQCLPSAVHSLSDSKVLVITRQNLDGLPTNVLKDNEMLDDIQKAFLREHAIQRDGKEVRCVFLWLFAVFRLP